MTGYYITFESVGNAVLKDFEIPELKDDEVLLESDYSTVSAGTGIGFRQMDRTRRLPYIYETGYGRKAASQTTYIRSRLARRDRRLGKNGRLYENAQGLIAERTKL